MRIFISGATGFIGSRLAIRLADAGNTIHALYRSESRTTIIKHPNIVLFKGDISDLQSLKAAIMGCEQVYHAAAYAKGYDPDLSRFYKLNVEGALNVVKEGIAAGVKKFVVTSTAGVYGPSGENQEINENFPKPAKYFIEYETTKALLESRLKELCKTGADIVLVNPTRVYGPGLLSKSNSATIMIRQFSEGRWRVIPGNGKSVGNYVHVEDVVTGHILAMKHGISGENYILGDENASFNRFFDELKSLTCSNKRMFHIPYPAMLLTANILLLYAKISGKEPLITPPLVNRYIEYWNVSSDRAINELGYKPRGLKEGLAGTLSWLNELKSIKNES